MRNFSIHTALYRVVLAVMRLVGLSVTIGAVLLPAPVAQGAAQEVATLSPAGTAPPFLGLAASNGTVAAAAPNTGQAPGQGRIDVFTKPVTGWGNEQPAATLTDPNALYGPFSPAIGDGVLVANVSGASRPSTDDVFVEPAGGWTGTVSPGARLVASSGSSLGGAAASGSTIVAAGRDTQGYEKALYVFTRPSDGWSGTIHESAILTDTHGATLGGFAISGRSAFAATDHGVDVFMEPSGGWTGELHQTATLANPIASTSPIGLPVQAAGPTTLVGSSVFEEPRSGWSGTVKTSAQLSQTSTSGQTYEEAISDHLAALNSVRLGANHQCPCNAQVTLFAEPSDGWSGTIAASPAITTTTDTGILPLALDPPYAFVTGGSTVQVYAVTGANGYRLGPPRISHLSASGLMVGKPRLRFALRAAPGGPPVRSLKLLLPRGLSVARNHRQVRRRVSITRGGRYTLSASSAALAAKLASPASQVFVSIRPGAIKESPAFLNAAKKARRHHKTPTVRLVLRANDVTGRTSTIFLVLKLR